MRGKAFSSVVWAVVFTVLLACVILLHRHRATERADLSAHKFPVTVVNSRKGDSVEYVWVSPEAMVRAWPRCSDASDGPIESSKATLALPDRYRLGNGYRVDSMAEVPGWIVVPETFNMAKYFRKGYDLQVSTRVDPNGFYSDEFPFEFDPRLGMGNAGGKFTLRQGFAQSSVEMTYNDPGKKQRVEQRGYCARGFERLLSALRLF